MHMDQDLAADVLETNQASHKIFLVNKFKLSIKYSHNSRVYTDMCDQRYEKF